MTHLEAIEEARSGFRQAIMMSVQHNDRIGYYCMMAHYRSVNSAITDLGGESCEPPDLERFLEDGDA